MTFLKDRIGGKNNICSFCEGRRPLESIMLWIFEIASYGIVLIIILSLFKNHRTNKKMEKLIKRIRDYEE